MTSLLHIACGEKEAPGQIKSEWLGAESSVYIHPPAQAGENSIDAPKPAASNCSLAVLALLQTRNGTLPDAVRSWPVRKPSPPRWIWQTK
jgi:hypothetical protein